MPVVLFQMFPPTLTMSRSRVRKPSNHGGKSKVKKLNGSIEDWRQEKRGALPGVLRRGAGCLDHGEELSGDQCRGWHYSHDFPNSRHRFHRSGRGPSRDKG